MIPENCIKIQTRYSIFLQSIFNNSEPEMYFDEDTHAVWFRFSASSNVIGPPDNAHGGFCATILDEAMGASVWLNGYTALAAKLSFSFKKSVPIGRIHYICARVYRSDKRRIYSKAEIFDNERNLLVKGEAVFISIDMKRFTDVPSDLKKHEKFHLLRKQGLSIGDAIKAMQ